MIPRATKLIGQERVGVRLSGSNGTLGHTRHTVLVGGTSLQEAVPVHGGALFRAGDVVVNSDLDGVSPVGLDHGSRVLAVDQKCRDLISVRRYRSSADGPVVAPDRTGSRSLAVRVGTLHSPVTPWLAVLHGSIVGQEERKHGSHEGSQFRFSVWQKPMLAMFQPSFTRFDVMVAYPLVASWESAAANILTSPAALEAIPCMIPIVAIVRRDESSGLIILKPSFFDAK